MSSSLWGSHFFWCQPYIESANTLYTALIRSYLSNHTYTSAAGCHAIINNYYALYNLSKQLYINYFTGF